MRDIYVPASPPHPVRASVLCCCPSFFFVSDTKPLVVGTRLPVALPFVMSTGVGVAATYGTHLRRRLWLNMPLGPNRWPPVG